MAPAVSAYLELTFAFGVPTLDVSRIAEVPEGKTRASRFDDANDDANHARHNTMKYLLPCSCGNSIPIETSQAGQTVTCSCGQMQEVPTMRAIRQLEPAHETAPAKRRPLSTAKWSISQRLLFTFGLAVAAIGFWFAGSLQFTRSRLDTQEVKWDTQLDTDLQKLETMNLEGAWETWIRVRDKDIGPYKPPPFMVARAFSERWRPIVLWTGGAGIIGLIMMGVAFVLPREKSPRAHQRGPVAK